ncbi:Galactose-binding-like [Holotrichia oblita]|uniref:Galactose-binding-like n=1 Tax=Holotrichia oblita TaxID=644536 RepID=A0ACB9SRR2_HOLOL|nr:Galactose-binding-like [Holotrichia oblita]
MNAADYYGLDELRRACAGFVQCCINVDTVCALLASAERYIQYKCTKSLVQKVLEFVDEHGNEVLNLGSFTLLPQHVVRLILARDELQADEFTKFQAALMWGKFFLNFSVKIWLKADPASVDPGKLSPNRVRRHAQGRSMSVQSSLDPYGSNTTLSSSGSSELVSSDGKHSSN